MKRLVILLALAAAAAVHAAERLPGVPTPEAIFADLRSGDHAATRKARAWLHLLDLADLEAISAGAERDGGMRDNHTYLERALLRRGHRPTIERHLVGLIDQGGGNAEEALSGLTPEALLPLASAAAERLEQVTRAGKPLPNTSWPTLAALSGHPALMRLLASEALAGGGRTWPPMPADPFAAAVAAGFARAKPEQRLALLQAMRAGWEQAPPAAIAAIAKDREPRLRAEFARTLGLSTHPEAAALAVALLKDDDVEVRHAAVEAVFSLRPRPPAETLRALALDAAAAPDIRARAWILVGRDAGFPLVEAQRLATAKTTPPQVRDAVITRLVTLGEAAWLLDRLDDLDADAQALAMRHLAADSTPAVLTAATRLLDRLPPAKASGILHALAAQRTAVTYALLIERLRDKRAEMRPLALAALHAASNLNGPGFADEAAPGGRPPAAGLDERPHRIWSAWYRRFHEPLDADRQADLDATIRILKAERGAGVTGVELPVWALVRLTADRGLGERALLALAKATDPTVAPILVELLDDPQFYQRPDAIIAVLRQRPADPDVAAGLVARLDGARAAQVAVLLASWRVESTAERLVQAVLVQGLGFDAAFRELVAWKHPAFVAAARKHALSADPKLDPAIRSRALRLLIATADEQDVRTIANQLRRPDQAATAALGLAQLAGGGLPAADAALAGAFTQKDPALAAIALRAAAEVFAQNPPATPPPAIAAAALVIANGKGAAEGEAFAALAAAGEARGAARLAEVLASCDDSVAARLVGQVLRTKRREAVPYAEAIAASPHENGATQAVAWLLQYGGWNQGEAEARRQELAGRAATAAEEALGKAVDGVEFSLGEVAAEWAPGGQPITLTVTVRNRRAKPVSLVRMGQASILVGSGAGFGYGNLVFPTATQAAPGTPPLVVAAGKSLTLKLTIAPPPYYHGAMAHDRARIEVNWHEAGESGVASARLYRGAWVPCSLIPKLWSVVDKRTVAR